MTDKKVPLTLLISDDSGVSGDINEDGKIDAVDYMLLKRYVLGTYGIADEKKAVADVNRDRQINAVDYMLLKRHVPGTYKIV